MGSMKLLAYIAAPWGEKPAARRIRDALAAKGVLSTASWIDRAGDDSDYSCLAAEALQDETDLRRAQILVAYVPDVDTSLGGRDTELGMALALGLEVILVGTPRQVFHRHPRVKQFDTIEKLEAEWIP